MDELRAKEEIEKLAFENDVLRKRMFDLERECAAMRKLCGEAADEVHLLEVDSKVRLKLYAKLADGANGALLKKASGQDWLDCGECGTIVHCWHHDGLGRCQCHGEYGPCCVCS